MQFTKIKNNINIVNSNKIIKKYEYKKEFYLIVKDLLKNPEVLQMKNYKHHFDSSCFEHCVEVAYWSYLICKKLNLDYVSIARAGILHDLFLYDWHNSKKRLNLPKNHAFIHSRIALENASKICTLNDKEKDIILKHMWPVTFFHFPKYYESFIITLTDKLSALNSFKSYIMEKLHYRISLRHNNIHIISSK